MTGVGVKIDIIPIDKVPVKIKSPFINLIIEKLDGISSTSAMKIEFETPNKAASAITGLKAYLKKLGIKDNFDINVRGKFAYIKLARLAKPQKRVIVDTPMEDLISGNEDHKPDNIAVGNISHKVDFDQRGSQKSGEKRVNVF